MHWPDLCHLSWSFTSRAWSFAGKTGRQGPTGTTVESGLLNEFSSYSDNFNQIARASAEVLQNISRYTGLTGTIQSLVISHRNYVIDALCQQLRHLEARAHNLSLSYSMYFFSRIHGRRSCLRQCLETRQHR